MKPTLETVRLLFEYCPNTGILTRKRTTSNNAKKGQLVGWINSDGYLNVKIDRRIFKVHQIAWLYVHGVWPVGVIDHINRDKLDNKIENLRDTTVQVNNINKGTRRDSKTGVPNVTWRERDKRFYAACRHNGRQNYLGSFKNIEAAKLAVENFKAEIGRNMK